MLTDQEIIQRVTDLLKAETNHARLLASVQNAVTEIYHRGNTAWRDDRPDLTQAYNISGELIEKAIDAALNDTPEDT